MDRRGGGRRPRDGSQASPWPTEWLAEVELCWWTTTNVRSSATSAISSSGDQRTRCSIRGGLLPSSGASWPDALSPDGWVPRKRVDTTCGCHHRSEEHTSELQ